MIRLGLTVLCSTFPHLAWACACWEPAPLEPDDWPPGTIWVEAVFVEEGSSYPSITSKPMSNSNWRRDPHPIMFTPWTQRYRVVNVLMGDVEVGDELALRTAGESACGYDPGEPGTTHFLVYQGRVFDRCGASRPLPAP